MLTTSMAFFTRGNIPRAYVASKHAVVGRMKNLFIELGKHWDESELHFSFCCCHKAEMELFQIKEKQKLEEFVFKVANLKGVLSEANDVAETVVPPV